MLYQEGLYNEVLLGSGSENVAVGFGPTDLNAYQNSMANIVLYWTMDPYSANIETQGWIWEVETSLASDFSNATSYSSATIAASDYISGVIYKGFVIPTYPRTQGATTRMYWRARVRMGDNQVSAWSSTTYDIPAANDGVIRDAVLAFLPDVLYDKSSASNIYKLQNSMTTELGLLDDEAQLTANDNFIFAARDSALEPNFGALVGITRPAAHDTVPALQNIDYRSILRAFMTNIRYAPTTDAISKMIFALYRSWPTFYNVSDEQADYIVSKANVAESQYYFYPASTPPGGTLEAYTLNRQNVDFGVIIEIADLMTPSDRLILTNAWAQEIIKQMIQAHVPVYFRYV